MSLVLVGTLGSLLAGLATGAGGGLVFFVRRVSDVRRYFGLYHHDGS